MQDSIFEKFKDNISNLDPVHWIEKNLTLDGKPFRINGNGYKAFSDIYRYIGVTATQRDSKPICLVKGRQVGGSSLACALSLYFGASGIFGTGNRPPMRVIHCFPTLVHVFTYAKTKLNPTISSAVLSPNKVRGKVKSVIEEKLDVSTPANDSLQYKQFVGGNFLRVESTGLDASRLRGSTGDCNFYDEVQDIPAEAISNANKLLTTAHYGRVGEGIQLYFGTPKQKGSAYWNIWNASTKQYFHLGCESCNELFPLYTPGSDAWEKIWLYGFVVKCPHCGCEQDKREATERGKWVALGDPDAEYIGFHINQLYLPYFDKEYIISQKPENHPINTERAYQNEVLGEFYSGDASPITPEEIQQKCADSGRKFRASISSSENKNVYAGFDWGKKKDVEGSQGQSYSTTVLLSDDGKGLLSVEFFTLLKRNDFEEKKSIVDQMFRQYSVKLGVGDIGYANDLTEILQKEHGDRFIASEASGHVNGHQKYVDEYFPKRVVFEKDYYIAEVYGLLKKGMIRFPYGDYEKIATLIQHICSMEIKTTMNRLGEPQQKYVKGPTPNDAFAALINAYIAYKFDITKGFKNGPGGSPFNQSGNRQIPAVLGFAPKFR